MIDSKDDGGLLKCKKIELNEVEEKSTGSSHEATSDDLNEKQPVKGNRKHKRNESVSDIFKERLVGFRKQNTKNMTFSDQLDIRNPQMVAEFATDIYSTMRTQEKLFMV